MKRIIAFVLTVLTLSLVVFPLFTMAELEESSLIEETEGIDPPDYSLFQTIDVQIKDKGVISLTIDPKLIEKMTVKDLYDLAYSIYLDGADNTTVYEFDKSRDCEEEK